MRNRALVAFTILTGMRDSAIASLRLKHIDIDRELVKQHPSEVRTKFSKRIDTFFFPVGDEIKRIVIDWVRYLREQKLFGNSDPVFPRTKMGQNDNRSFIVQGLEPECWANTGPIRKIFKQAFENADLTARPCFAARCSAVHPVFSVALTLAPRLMSAMTVSACPSLAAKCSAIQPFLSFALISAPCSIRASILCVSPTRAASRKFLLSSTLSGTGISLLNISASFSNNTQSPKRRSLFK